MEKSERKYNIGESVLIIMGKNQLKGRISRQTETNLTKINEYFVHTILGTFLLEEDGIIKYSDSI